MNTKSRVISLRVTEAQYEELERLRQLWGANSISEALRGKLCEQLEEEGNGGGESLAAALSRLDERVGQIGREMKRLGVVLSAIRRGPLVEKGAAAGYGGNGNGAGSE